MKRLRIVICYIILLLGLLALAITLNGNSDNEVIEQIKSEVGIIKQRITEIEFGQLQMMEKFQEMEKENSEDDQEEDQGQDDSVNKVYKIENYQDGDIYEVSFDLTKGNSI